MSDPEDRFSSRDEQGEQGLRLDRIAQRLAAPPHAPCGRDCGLCQQRQDALVLLAAVREARALLLEGRELAFSNQRAATMRRRLWAWGEKVEAVEGPVVDG